MSGMTIGKLAQAARVRFIKRAQELGFSLADLERLCGTLRELIGRCDSARGKVACPIIETLARAD